MNRIIIILVIALLGCNKSETDLGIISDLTGFIAETVKEGDHPCNIPTCMFKGNAVRYEVYYPSESWYDQGQWEGICDYCIGDINKEGGPSIETGHAHYENSGRFGYRFVIDEFGNMKVEVLWYCWIDGKSPQETGAKGSLGLFDLDKVYLHEVVIEDGCFVFYIDHKEVARQEIGAFGLWWLENSPLKNYLWTCHHYHGGNCKAPQDVTIYKRYIEPALWR